MGNKQKMHKAPQPEPAKEIPEIYSKIKNLNDSSKDPASKKIILLTTGALNPIHRMHLLNFIIANNFLKSKSIEVLCGLVSPSADCYVQCKRNPFIPFTKRCEFVLKAINEQKCDIPLFLHTWEGDQEYFVDFPEVRNTIQDDIKKFIGKNIVVVYLCGMDHFQKCRLNFWNNVIAIDRMPYIINNYEQNDKKFIYCIQDNMTKPYSSTELNDLVRKDDEESIKKIKEITYDSVAESFCEWFKGL